ncbi:hypothetical protein BC332_25500 [Capsicum chinense]|nr:hypothetical protein BC332_25500 [Capsicum chinense]
MACIKYGDPKHHNTDVKKAVLYRRRTSNLIFNLTLDTYENQKLCVNPNGVNLKHIPKKHRLEKDGFLLMLRRLSNNSIYTIASAEQRAKYDTDSDTEDEDTNIHGKSQQVEGPATSANDISRPKKKGKKVNTLLLLDEPLDASTPNKVSDDILSKGKQINTMPSEGVDDLQGQFSLATYLLMLIMEYVTDDQGILKALDKIAGHDKELQKTKKEDNHHHNLYLAKEDLILEGMPAAEGVSVSDMYKHKGKVSQRFFLYSNPECSGRNDFMIRVRLCRMWDVINHRKNGKLISVEMIFINEKKNLIYGIMDTNQVNRLKGMLKEGSLFTIKNFKVVESTFAYRPIESSFTIILSASTVMNNLAEDLVDIPINGFQFIKPTMIDSRVDNHTVLSDVVGCLYEIGDIENCGSKDKTMEIKIITDYFEKVKISLWEELGDKFAPSLYNKDVGPYIVIVTSTTVKEFCEVRFFTTHASRIYVNLDIDYVRSLVQKFTTMSMEVQIIERSNVNNISIEEDMILNLMDIKELFDSEWSTEIQLANDESDMVNNAKVVVNLPRNRACNSYGPGGTIGRAEYRHKKYGFYAPTRSATESFPIDLRGGDEKHNNNKQGKAHGLCRTVIGRVGEMFPFTSRDDVEFFTHLKMYLRKEFSPLSGRDHMAYKSAYLSVKHQSGISVVPTIRARLPTGFLPAAAANLSAT